MVSILYATKRKEQEILPCFGFFMLRLHILLENLKLELSTLKTYEIKTIHTLSRQK